MKVFISCDLEGIYGANSWEDVNKNAKMSNYKNVVSELTKQLIYICNKLRENGVNEIIIKDGHSRANNISQTDFPEYVKVINSCGGNYLSMMYGIDETFDFAIFVGYHAPVVCNENKLGHVISSNKYEYIKINERLSSEFIMNLYTALVFKVSVLLVTGDSIICDSAKIINKNIKTIVTNKMKDTELFSEFDLIIKEIITLNNREVIKLPEKFKIEVKYKKFLKFIKIVLNNKNIKISGYKRIAFQTKDWLEVLKLLKRI